MGGSNSGNSDITQKSSHKLARARLGPRVGRPKSSITAKLLARRREKPVPDQISKEKPPAIADEEQFKRELWDTLHMVQNTDPSQYYHDKFDGIYFSQEEVNLAIGMVVEAVPVVLEEDARTSISPDLGSGIKENREFQQATMDGDRKKQMMLSLYYLMIAKRAGHLMKCTQLGLTEADEQAREDINSATAILANYRLARYHGQQPEGFEEEVRRMLSLSNSDQFKDLPELELALHVIDEKTGISRPPEETKPFELVFPLPNIAVNQHVSSLERLLNQRFPAYDDGGNELVGNRLVRRVARTLVNYIMLNQSSASTEQQEFTFKEQFAEHIRTRFKRNDKPVEINEKPHPIYQDAVDELLKNYSDESLVEFSLSLVNRHLREQKQWEVFDIYEEVIVLKALKKDGVVSKDDIHDFLKMHPGVRELRLRNFLSTVTDSSTLKEYRRAKNALYKRYELPEPTQQQKIEAISELGNLTHHQRTSIAYLFNVERSGLLPLHAESFVTWASEPGNKYAALELWKRGHVDLLTLGELAYKLRFSNKKEYSKEEMKLLQEVLGTKLTDEKIANFNHMLIEKIDEKRLYFKELLDMYSKFDGVKVGSLIVATRRQTELHTLLDFIGIDTEKARVVIDNSNAISRSEIVKQKITGQAEEVEKYKDHNEDSVLCLQITLSDNRKILIDAVFDGIGGSTEGERASNMAKDVLEIFATAGWIKSPEDLRRAIIIADLAIVMTQIADKPEFDSRSRENSMGTTAVVTYQDGDKFYGLHCGDSTYRIIRDGKVVLRSNSHTYGNMILKSGDKAEIPRHLRQIVLSSLGASMAHFDVNNIADDYGPFKLLPNDIIAVNSDGVDDVVCEHEYIISIEQANGDLYEANEKIISTAESRRGRQRFDTFCSCDSVKGKNDDKSLVLRYSDEGLSADDNVEGEILV